MARKITIVNITSLSFTGTTWVNTLLGCHEKAFALGPPNRIYTLLENENVKDACRVHPERCEFWNGFFQNYVKKKNFYIQLAEYANKDFIIINNPSHGTEAYKAMKHKNIEIKSVTVVRDGRATCNSAMKYLKNKDYFEIVTDFFAPSAGSLFWDTQCQNVFCVRYEDIVKNQFEFIKNIGNFIGLEYPENFYKFWEFNHHITAGNANMYKGIRYFQEDKINIENEFYKKEFERLRNDAKNPILDNRWIENLNSLQKFIFDLIVGDINERWGYNRDKFSINEFLEFAELVMSHSNSIDYSEIKLEESKMKFFKRVFIFLKRKLKK